MSARLRFLLSLAFASVLVAFVFSQLDVATFVRVLFEINYLGFLCFMLVFNVLLLLADSVASWHVYSVHVGRVALREIVILRGASYLPSLLNYHIGQAWLTWLLARVYQRPIASVAGATLLVYASTFASLCLMALGSYALSPGRISWLPAVLVATFAAGLVYLVVIALRPRVLQRLRTSELLINAGVRGHLKAVAFRFPHVLILWLGMWLPFEFFSVHIPLPQALAYIPILMLVGALPLTPQGVGTRELLAVELLSGAAGNPLATKEHIVAATVSWACALTITEAIISWLLLPSAHRLLGREAGAGALRDGPSPQIP